MNNRLLEHILSYSDHNGILENELVEPLEEDDNLNQLFEKIYFECRLKPLFEQAYRESHLREMSSPTSETLAQTFAGILKSIGISEKDPITDDKLIQATNKIIIRYGAGKQEGLNFNLSEDEKNSENQKKLIFQILHILPPMELGFCPTRSGVYRKVEKNFYFSN